MTYQMTVWLLFSFGFLAPVLLPGALFFASTLCAISNVAIRYSPDWLATTLLVLQLGTVLAAMWYLWPSVVRHLRSVGLMTKK